MSNMPLKELHETLGVHDANIWTSECNNDVIKACSCGVIWWNNKQMDEKYEYAPKLWYFGMNCPDEFKKIIEKMGGRGTACATGVRDINDMKNAVKDEIKKFARVISDMITHNRLLPPKHSIPSYMRDKLMDSDELFIMLKMEKLSLFDK